MKAKEAAEQAKMDYNLTIEEVRKQIPDYSNPLPRRAWIKSFLTALPEDLRIKFADLK
jgi:hypothetical protein